MFDQASLDRHLPSAGNGLFRELQTLANSSSSGPSMPASVASRVGQRVIESMGDENASKTQVAESLGMSVRTFHANLRA